MMRYVLVVCCGALYAAACSSDTRDRANLPSGSGTPEDTLELCTNGIDDDGDTYIDCEETTCMAIPAACGGEGNEDTNTACRDGVDNDGDTFVDCDDAECETFCAEDNDVACSDGIDNDENGYIDCNDFNCSRNENVTVCGEENTDALCDDGLDNDEDGYIDCDDFDCLYGEGVTVCGGGGDPEDNDTACSDGLDNDGDSYIDCDDYDCLYGAGVTVCGGGDPEDNDTACSDGLDNDGDSYTDCDDYDCLYGAGVTVCGGGDPEDNDTACSDGLDNDGDSYIDCDDYDCSRNAALAVCPAVEYTTIHAIQDEADPNHVEIPAGEETVRVQVECVTVTSAPSEDRYGGVFFFVQDKFPPDDVSYEGIEVYADDMTPDVSVGARINLRGFYRERFGLSRIDYGVHAEATGCLESTTVTPFDTAVQEYTTVEKEELEGVLVRLNNAIVHRVDVQSTAGSSPTFDDFAVRSSLWSGGTSEPATFVISTRFVDSGVSTGQVYSSITGVVTYLWGQYRLAPLTAEGLVEEVP